MRRLLKIAPSLAVGGVLVALVLPRYAGTGWRDIAATLGGLTVGEVAVLVALWFLGLYVYTFVLTASLPRLSRGRALTLNLTGSAVSNLVPFGGALGITLNYAMCRGWGFSRPSFALYTLLTNVWNTVLKLSLPALALVALLLTDNLAQHSLALAAIGGLVAFGAIGLALVAALSSERRTVRLGRLVQSGAHAVLRAVRSRTRVELEQPVVHMRRQCLIILRTLWHQISLGMLGYAALQTLLMWASLHMLGSHLSLVQVFAGYSVERILTLAMFTPGGAGLAELGTTALLIGLGGDPLVTVSGVLLYRAFTFGLEIPVGAAGLLVWLVRHRRRPQPGAPAGEPAPETVPG
ncbi:MAG TPA: lysylphosphatidylglycerol synthase domain-containing protein [Nocardioidaceae bacterium]|nr:lysylphosphatidylglycerol synthase domain-containing protein [Nocardioidaceae bacterium]